MLLKKIPMKIKRKELRATMPKIIKYIPNLTTRRQDQHSSPVVTVKEEPFVESFESPTESISSSSLDPINTIETNMKEIDVFVFGEY
mmetsp:Transcript_34617/g.35209  ORF Transcript_34617/g.35209 Transcript_34617/m.35209 type:complete len:87 (-) Transcript_34617:107-367(-)